MNAQAHDELIDRIADACWSHALQEPCELKIRDVERLLRLYLAERQLTDQVYRCLMGQAGGREIAATIRNYVTSRTQ